MQIYPTVNGLGFPVKRIATWDTLVQEGSSGREVRLSYWQNPIWKWELTYNYLKDNLIDASSDFATIEGFFNQMAGRYAPFLYDDVTPGVTPGSGPWDSVLNETIGSGDGVTTTFQLLRTTGGFQEWIQAPYTSPVPKVYANGVLKTYGTDYSVNAVGQVIFAVAPSSSPPTLITWTGSYYFPVRFDMDDMEFDEIMYLLFECKTVKLIQVRL